MRLGDVGLDRETETEAGPFIGRLAEGAHRYRWQVLITRQVVQAHELQGLATDDARPLQLATVGQGLGETVVVIDGRDQAAAAGEEAMGPGERGLLGIILQTETVAGLVLVAGGEAIDLVGGHREVGVLHAQRLEQMLDEVILQTHAGKDLHQVADHIGCHRVVPCGARREFQGQAREFVHQPLQRQAGAAIELQRAVGGIHIGAVHEAVGQARLMGEQVAHGHRSLGGRGHELGVDAGLVDPQVLPGRDVLVHRIVEQEAALFVELHECNRRHRLGHRVHAKQGVAGYRLVALHIHEPLGMQPADLATPCYQGKGARQLARLYVGLINVRGDAAQASGMQAGNDG